MCISLKKTTVDLNSKGLPGGGIPRWFILAIPNLLTTQDVECPHAFFVLAFGLKHCESFFLNSPNVLYGIIHEEFFFSKGSYFSVSSVVCRLNFLIHHSAWTSWWRNHSSLFSFDMECLLDKAATTNSLSQNHILCWTNLALFSVSL